MDAAIAEAKLSEDKPTLIIARTTIGKGSPNRQGPAKVHGEALGDEEIAATARRDRLALRSVRGSAGGL